MIGHNVVISRQVRVDLSPPNYILLDEGTSGEVKAVGFRKEHYMVSIDLGIFPAIRLVVQLHRDDLEFLCEEETV